MYKRQTQVGTDTTWGTDFKQISASYGTLFIKTNGTLWSWGNNSHGQLGQNSPTNSHRSSPTQVGTDTTWSDVSGSGFKRKIAIKTDGTLWSWGYNNFGTLGQNSRVYLSSPTQVGTATNWMGSTMRGNRNTLTIMREG